MQAMNFLQQTSRRLIIHHTSRSTFSALSYSKLSQTQTKTDNNTTSTNYPGFYDTANADRVEAQNLRKTIISSPKIEVSSSVPPNDLLEAKRLAGTKENDKKTPIVTSSEKFSSGLSPIQATSSISPTSDGLFHDAKVSSTPLSPGIPIRPNVSSKSKEDDAIKDEEQVPSSGFSAFLRGIRSGLPFFPSSKTTPRPIDITTTREHFIPVC